MDKSHFRPFPQASVLAIFTSDVRPRMRPMRCFLGQSCGPWHILSVLKYGAIRPYKGIIFYVNCDICIQPQFSNEVCLMGIKAS